MHATESDGNLTQRNANQRRTHAVLLWLYLITISRKLRESEFKLWYGVLPKIWQQETNPELSDLLKKGRSYLTLNQKNTKLYRNDRLITHRRWPPLECWTVRTITTEKNRWGPRPALLSAQGSGATYTCILPTWDSNTCEIRFPTYIVEKKTTTN